MLSGQFHFRLFRAAKKQLSFRAMAQRNCVITRAYVDALTFCFIFRSLFLLSLPYNFFSLDKRIRLTQPYCSCIATYNVGSRMRTLGPTQVLNQGQPLPRIHISLGPSCRNALRWSLSPLETKKMVDGLSMLNAEKKNTSLLQTSFSRWLDS